MDKKTDAVCAAADWKKIVVTGATSFIGSVVTRQLLAAGFWVAAVVRPGSRNLEQLHRQIPEGCQERLQIVLLDLHEIGAIGQYVPEADGWIHMGWDGAGSDNRMKRQVQQDNVRQSLEAVRAAAALGCRRFLFTGSQAEYGICHSLISEEMPCNPVSEYGKAKVDFANQAKNLCKILKIEYIHTRIFSVYGPGDHPWSLVQSCLRTWLQGGQMKLGECTQQWNFLYVEDAASALVHLLAEGEPGCYNVAGHDTRILRQYIREMYELCGSRGSFVYGERPQNAEGPADLMPDIRKICEATGWQPSTSFAEGIYEVLYRMQKETS